VNCHDILSALKIPFVCNTTIVSIDAQYIILIPQDSSHCSNKTNKTPAPRTRSMKFNSVAGCLHVPRHDIHRLRLRLS
jgi:hypothetical protein